MIPGGPRPTPEKMTLTSIQSKTRDRLQRLASQSFAGVNVTQTEAGFFLDGYPRQHETTPIGKSAELARKRIKELAETP